MPQCFIKICQNPLCDTGWLVVLVFSIIEPMSLCFRECFNKNMNQQPLSITITQKSEIFCFTSPAF